MNRSDCTFSICKGYRMFPLGFNFRVKQETKEKYTAIKISGWNCLSNMNRFSSFSATCPLLDLTYSPPWRMSLEWSLSSRLLLASQSSSHPPNPVPTLVSLLAGLNTSWSPFSDTLLEGFIYSISICFIICTNPHCHSLTRLSLLSEHGLSHIHNGIIRVGHNTRHIVGSKRCLFDKWNLNTKTKQNKIPTSPPQKEARENPSNHWKGAPGKKFSWAGRALFWISPLARVQKLVCISSSSGYWFEVLFVTAAFCSFPNLLSGISEFKPWN